MLDELIRQGTALIVAKEKIAATGDYNLSGERYRETGLRTMAIPVGAASVMCVQSIRVSARSLRPSDSEILVSFVPMADLNEIPDDVPAMQPTKVLSEVSPSYIVFGR